jgi:hypothetical protein
MLPILSTVRFTMHEKSRKSGRRWVGIAARAAVALALVSAGCFAPIRGCNSIRGCGCEIEDDDDDDEGRGGGWGGGGREREDDDD